MNGAVHVAGFAPEVEIPRHSFLVRSTHWINAASVVGLVVSGVAILLAHPRLYWGETGALGMPALIDLPLPMLLTGQSGWGRSLHFLSAWVCVLTGLLYVSGGLLTHHFARHLLAGTASTMATGQDPPAGYSPLQRITYLLVVFVLFPVMIWTGFAMSPAITSVVPFAVTSLGGLQSARTMHFFGACLVTTFTLLHVVMVSRAGFARTVIPMITGHLTAAKVRE